MKYGVGFCDRYYNVTVRTMSGKRIGILSYFEEMMTFKNRTVKYLSVPVHLSIPTTRLAFSHSLQYQWHLFRQGSVQLRDMRVQIRMRSSTPASSGIGPKQRAINIVEFLHEYHTISFRLRTLSCYNVANINELTFPWP